MKGCDLVTAETRGVAKPHTGVHTGGIGGDLKPKGLDHRERRPLEKLPENRKKQRRKKKRVYEWKFNFPRRGCRAFVGSSHKLNSFYFGGDLTDHSGDIEKTKTSSKALQKGIPNRMSGGRKGKTFV